jgi:hypothetical protein
VRVGNNAVCMCSSSNVLQFAVTPTGCVQELLHFPALSLMEPTKFIVHSEDDRIRAPWKAINLSDRATVSFTK